MAHKPNKAVVATVVYAGFNFPGLKLTDGNYGIAIPQIVELFQRSNKGFQFLKNNAQRDIKHLLGKDFQFLKSASEIHPKKVNVLTLEQFGELVFYVAFKGNDVAKAILKASVTTTIEQAFDLAFDEKKSLEEYQQRIEARVQGKLTRRQLTDSIKDYIEKHSKQLSDNYKKWIFSNCTDAVYRIVFDRSAKKLREDWECKDPRENMNYRELNLVERVEETAMALIDIKEYEPLTAVKETEQRLLIQKIMRSNKTQ